MASLAIAGVRVWDGESEERSIEPLTIRVEGEWITAIGSAPELRADAEVLSFDAATALPGLTDAHVHFCIDPEIRTPEAQDEVPFERRERAMEARALAMAQAGITTARDLGGGAWREIALRDRIVAGQIPGPRILCAGQPLTTTRGHCWFWGGEAVGEAEIQAVIARQVERRADWIKVMATGGITTKGTNPGDVQFEAAELRLAVACAARHDRPVAAHCHGTEGIRRAAQAGVRTIEHCSFAGGEGFGSALDLEVVRSIAQCGAWVSPTVNAGWKRFLDPEPKLAAFGARMSEVPAESAERGGGTDRVYGCRHPQRRARSPAGGARGVRRPREALEPGRPAQRDFGSGARSRHRGHDGRAAAGPRSRHPGRRRGSASRSGGSAETTARSRARSPRARRGLSCVRLADDLRLLTLARLAADARRWRVLVSPRMKASEILTAVLLSPLAIWGGLPGVIVFAGGISAHVVVNVAKERERDDSVARETAQRLREAEAKPTAYRA